jgi:hypothetical protein
LDALEEVAGLVLGLFGLEENDSVAILLDPLVLETIALSDTRDFLAADEFLYTVSRTPSYSPRRYAQVGPQLVPFLSPSPAATPGIRDCPSLLCPAIPV